MSNLPDLPNVWSEVDQEGFSERWLPGAFGDLASIETVNAFRIEQEEIELDGDVYRRTVIKAQITAGSL